MGKFSYEAIDADGKIIEGELTAGSSQDIAQNLISRNLTVVNIEPARLLTKKIRFSSTIKSKDKLIFTTYLATMLKAGLSPLSAIDVLVADTKNKAMQTTLEETRSSLERGRSLSSSLSQFPDIFDSSFTAVVKAGETSGNLVESLNNLSQKIRQDEELVGKIKNALIYPAVIFVTLIVVGMSIIIFIFPKVIKVFESLNVKLPLSTKILIGLTKIVSFNYFLTLGALIIAGAGTISFFRSQKGKNVLNALLNHTPYLNSINHAINLARVNSTMSLLLKAGVPIERSIEIVSRIVTSPHLQKTLLVAIEGIESGVGVAQSLKESSRLQGGAVPDIMLKVIEVGEKTGTLDEVLTTLSESYHKDADDKIKNFISFLEPILMVIVGVGVGLMILSIIGPIYKVIGGVVK